MPLYSSAGASASASAAAASAASFAAARSSAAFAAAAASSLFFCAAAPAVERLRFANLRLAEGTAPLTGPERLSAKARVEVARAEESCGTLQERHFAHAGVTSQETLRGALEPLNVALPLPALRTLRLYLLLADNERRTGSGGDGACKGQWPDIQRGAGRKAHGEGEQESEHERERTARVQISAPRASSRRTVLTTGRSLITKDPGSGRKEKSAEVFYLC